MYINLEFFDNELVVWKCDDGTWKKERVKH